MNGVMNDVMNNDLANQATTAPNAYLIGPDDLILVTGATGFIGSRVVWSLLNLGFRNLRCLARPSSKAEKVDAMLESLPRGARLELVRGNLLSREDCAAITRDVAVVIHLAAGRSEKSVPDAFANSVVTTRNLLDAVAQQGSVRRFVNISSFAVYSNINKTHRGRLDESCPVEEHPALRGDAYSFAKVRQDEMVQEYGKKLGIPYVIVRPGYVYGPGNLGITNRVGIGTFGLFLHLGGSNSIPFTYVDNCADAIALAGVTAGIDGEVFNVVDDDLPSSRQFLRWYKRNVRRFASLYVPHFMSYTLCYLWERYSEWSEGQLPLAFNRRKWHNVWKKTSYTNRKLKTRMQWAPRVSTQDGMERYFEACRAGRTNA
jgi:nucleoside-diphosphate-sugar epimerase